MSNNQFEEYLSDVFFSEREVNGVPITKDNCTDLFWQWLTEMDIDLMLAHGDKFGTLCKMKAVTEFVDKFNKKN